LEDIESITVATYTETHPGSPPIVEQDMAAPDAVFLAD
jgi:hypothetical protein